MAVRTRPVNKNERKFAVEKRYDQKSLKILDEKLVMVRDISEAKPEEVLTILTL